ncbi:phosphoglycerate mutase family protein [Cloacibacterium sp.]|uniref:phosphoglycerate mutase family protein n=1 Tax=Cloacibacterium sp. TaxID=1913682 RepID=UPI0035AEF3DA
MKIFKTASFLLLLSLFSYNLTFSQQKVDTVFVGKATSKTIKQSIDKKALVYIIVRHGEKENNGKNPHLSEPGKERAKHLAQLFKKVKIQNAFSTDFFRTKETLEPLAVDKKLDFKIYNPSKISDFVKNDLIFNQSKNIISGHSNTNPVLLNEICKKSIYKDIPDTQFNDIFIVNVFKNREKIIIYHLLY